MEPTLFAFIWKYSKRQQLGLLLITVLSFPLLYVALELPKRIINDAIGSTTSQIDLWGYSISQIEYLLLLCSLFLAAVLVSGLVKMRLNTLKGVLSERLLRRLRYQLISRMMRFPKPFFRSTSQGELVSMITSEAEPMGGLMGDAVAQPVFQFGQMMTIVTFLFMQSVWFGLASVALIPLQAWLIPKLQRKINLLNKARITEVRHLASEIGESAAGISDLRANGGWRYRLAMFTDRLGRLFDIRLLIYKKKFFMKFLNNFITQLTPFLFYSVGGYLAIQGQITVGALVAALAAYKDLSSPWKDLLFYYNQVQDMSLRWEIVTERFAPKGMIDPALFDGEPDSIPRLNGDIEFHNVTVRDQDGHTILEGFNLTIQKGMRVAIQCNNAAERAAIGQLLSREVLPTRGKVTVSGYDIEDLHQLVIAARIGYAHSRPYLFDGTVGDNLLMPLRAKPQQVAWDPEGRDRHRIEAKRTGNSLDSLDTDWIDPGLAGLTDAEDIRDWWFTLVEAMGIDESVFRRTMRSRFDPALHADLAQAIVDLRPEIARRLAERGLDDVLYRFEPDKFNPAVPLAGNLLFASPVREISQQGLATETVLLKLVHEQGLAEDALTIAMAVMSTLEQAFGRDGTDHPLFLRLGMGEDTYLQISDIVHKYKSQGEDALSEDERSLLMTVPFLLTAEQIGPSFPEEYKEKILAIRKSEAMRLVDQTEGMFVPIAPDTYVPRLTVVENAIYGRVSIMAGAKADEVENVVAETLAEHGLRGRLASVMYDMPTGFGGAKLPTVIQERAAFSRAGIKRPDILVLDKALASHDAHSRFRTRQELRKLLPDAIMIFMEDKFEHPEAYDLFLEIKHGRIVGTEPAAEDDLDGAGVADLRHKLRIIAGTDLFGELDARNQRLLAFSAQWYEASAGQRIFIRGDPADAAYLCLEGRAELVWLDANNVRTTLSSVEPGRVIGDLAIIMREPRELDLVAVSDSKFLRIGAEEFRAVVENDVSVAVKLLERVSGHLVEAAETMRQANVNMAKYVNPNSGNRPEKPAGETDDR